MRVSGRANSVLTLSDQPKAASVNQKCVRRRSTSPTHAIRYHFYAQLEWHIRRVREPKSNFIILTVDSASRPEPRFRLVMARIRVIIGLDIRVFPTARPSPCPSVSNCVGFCLGGDYR